LIPSRQVNLPHKKYGAIAQTVEKSGSKKLLKRQLVKTAMKEVFFFIALYQFYFQKSPMSGI
jgi:hypothetical protein